MCQGFTVYIKFFLCFVSFGHFQRYNIITNIFLKGGAYFMEDNRPSLDELIEQAEAQKKNNKKPTSNNTENERVLILEK